MIFSTYKVDAESVMGIFGKWAATYIVAHNAQVFNLLSNQVSLNMNSFGPKIIHMKPI